MKRFGVIIVSDGPLSAYLGETVARLLGDIPQFSAVTLLQDDPWDVSVNRMRTAVEEVDRSNGILVLADIAGGTPFNVAQSLRRERNIEVIGGMNLPLVIKAVQVADEMPLAEAAVYLERYGRDHITRGIPRRISTDHGN